MFIVENNMVLELQLMSFPTCIQDLRDSVLYDCLVGFCQAAHQKLLSDTRNFETAEKIMVDQNIDRTGWI